MRIGIGGPVGSGKMALVAALCRALATSVSIVVVTNDIFTTEDAEALRRMAVLADERIMPVETGACPHTAIRDDISANLDAVEQLEAANAPVELTLVESGGDNLTAIFSRALVDRQIFVIDVAGGDKVPRKGPALKLMLVNGAAGPLGGDRLSFELRVGPGASVVVRSVAAAMAQPGPHGEASTLHVELAVAEGATLDWAARADGQRHRQRSSDGRGTSADSTSIVTVREGVSLGRHRELPGRLALRQRVTIDDIAVLDHETVFAPGALQGPGAHGAGRTVTSTIDIAPTCRRRART